MAFTEHKITDFAHRLSDLPDQPNLSAAELKAYFDSSPEELRQALNGICTDAARLDDRVSGIVAETFGDSIPKSMLSTELQAEIDAKAEQAALETETAARKAAIQSTNDHLQTVELQKAEVYCGVYKGDGQAERVISLGFRPKAVLLMPNNALVRSDSTSYGGLAVDGAPVIHVISNLSGPVLDICDTGFMVYDGEIGRNYIRANTSSITYHYIAVK